MAVRAQRVAAADSIGSLGDKEFMLMRQIDEQKRQIAEQEKLVLPLRPPVGLRRTALTAFYWRGGPRSKGKSKISPVPPPRRIPR